MFLKEPEGTGCGLRHLEAELMALVAEVLRFAVHVVAVRAVKLVLIMRGDVRIRRLDVLRLLNEVLRVVARRARLDVGRGGIGLVGAVAVRPMAAWRSAPNLPSAAAAVPAARIALMSMTASGRKCFIEIRRGNLCLQTGEEAPSSFLSSVKQVLLFSRSVSFL